MLGQINQSSPAGGAVIKVIAALAVLLVGGAGMVWLKGHGPKASKEDPTVVVPVVRVVRAEFFDKQLYVNTQGRVDPRIRTQAAAEVMGRVLRVSSKFKSGGQFAKGEVMLEMDGADYVAALAQAESVLADARLSLEREEARAAQARRDWKKLGRGDPSELVLGIPQIVSAKARVVASQAAVDKASRDLKRTKLRAPYDCLVETIYTDLGSYITPGARLADLYSTEAFEVRVPVTLEEFGYLEQGEGGVVGGDVTLQASIGGKMRYWKGSIIRSEGRVDRSTMTMYQVVKIKPNPDEKLFPLPPSGLFVTARIKGRVMSEVVELPRAALREDQTVLVLDAESRLRVVKVGISRTLEKSVLVHGGVNAGDQIVISPLETPVVGMKLQIFNTKP